MKAQIDDAVEQSLAEMLSGSVFIDGDWVETKDQDPEGDVRLIQLADIGDGVFRNRSSRFLTTAKAKELRCTFLEPGDVLVARMPEPLGRACIFPGIDQPSVTVVDVCILRPDPELVSADWLVNVINSPDFRNKMHEFIRTTRQRISRRNLGSLRLATPPLEIQLAIAETVDACANERLSCSAHVEAARNALQKFRHSVLASACTGRLTADWRKAHPHVESPEHFVRRSEPVKGSKQSPNDDSSLPSDNDLSLPSGWIRTNMGSLVDIATGATPLRRRKDYYGGSIPWVTSGSVNAGTILEPTEFITELAIKDTNAKVFPAGTLLVAMYGEGQTRGRVAELGIDAATNQAVGALIFDESSGDLRDFLRLFWTENYERIRQLSFGGVQPNLSLGVLRSAEISLPPLDEQKEILRRVGQLMAVASEVEQQSESVLSTLSRSSLSVLSKAFRGELVREGSAGGN